MSCLIQILIVLIFSVNCNAAVSVWSDNIINKYRKNGEDGITGTIPHTLKMAKNEFEDMQILVYANGEELTNVDIEVSTPSKGDGATIQDVHLYYQWYVDTAFVLPGKTVAYRSNASTEWGKWPDALVPKVDRYYGEARNKFPFSVPSGELQGVVVEFGTEITATPGTYTCTATVTGTGSVSGAFLVSVPITIIVWNITIPQEPTYHAQIYAFYRDIMYGHGRGVWPGWSTTTEELYRNYNKMLLYHRISNFSTNSSNPTWNGSAIAYNWKEVDDFLIPAIKGELITSGPYAGNKMKSTSIFNAHVLYDTGEAATTAYYQAWWNHFVTAGVDPRSHLFAKLYDEPTGATIPKVANLSVWLNNVDTGGPPWENGWTTSKNIGDIKTSAFDTNGFYVPPARSYVCPYWMDYPARNIPAGQCVAGGSSSEAGIRSNYTPTTQHWMYNACDSFGCGVVEDTAQLSGEQGWSAIDVQGAFNRFFSLSMWKYRQTGIHYFAATQMMCDSGDYDTAMSGSWKTTFNYGVHGDGILMYPGVPSSTGKTWITGGGCYAPVEGGIEFIGGTHDIPIASLRLKYIRDGLEDLEIYSQAAAINSTSLNAIVDTKFNNPNDLVAYWHGTMTADTIIAARESAGDVITGNYVKPSSYLLRKFPGGLRTINDKLWTFPAQ